MSTEHEDKHPMADKMLDSLQPGDVVAYTDSETGEVRTWEVPAAEPDDEDEDEDGRETSAYPCRCGANEWEHRCLEATSLMSVFRCKQCGAEWDCE